jgi:hypothetical protein
VRVDADAPTGTLDCPATVTVGATASGTYTATDAGAGLATPATGRVVLDTAAPGARTARVLVEDRVGHGTELTCEHAVVYDWRGFAAPFRDRGVRHVVTAGQTVPLRFDLAGDRGPAVLARAVRTVDAACRGRRVAVAEELPAGAPALTYDAGTGTYTAAVATDPAWAGTCREVVLTLADGTEQTALLALEP